MLETLQQHLSDIYQVDGGYDVRDYLITDPDLAQCLSRGAMLTNTDESLLVAEDEEGLSLSLFLDSDMLDRLESANPLDRLEAHQLDDLWKVLEGISHFNCIVWKALQDRPVSLLELELQGEIDKFVSTTFIAMAQADEVLASRLHGWLFDDVSFREDLDDAGLDRYRAANDYAARFCRSLADELAADGRRALDTLRHFYRLPFGDKISHIHARAF
jgi:hypothetical protein